MTGDVLGDWGTGAGLCLAARALAAARRLIPGSLSLELERCRVTLLLDGIRGGLDDELLEFDLDRRPTAMILRLFSLAPVGTVIVSNYDQLSSLVNPARGVGGPRSVLTLSIQLSVHNSTEI